MSTSMLDDAQRAQFEAIARTLGHDVDELAEGRAQDTQITVRSIDHARRLMSRAGPAERERRGRTFFDLIAPRLDRIEGYHDRAYAYIFADAKLRDEDLKYVDKYLPVDVKALSLDNKTLAPNEVWVLGVNAPAVAINLGTLTMGPGSKIVAFSTVVSFSCQELIRQTGHVAHTAVAEAGASPHFGYLNGNYDFGFLGLTPDEWVRLQLQVSGWMGILDAGTVTEALAQTFAQSGLNVSIGARITPVRKGQAWRIADFVFMRTYSLVRDPLSAGKINVYQVAMQGIPGSQGGQPGQARAGSCTCSNTEPGSNGERGYTGGNGSNGGTGGQGDDGITNLRAELNIGSLTGNLVVRTVGGNAAQGGQGGTGGDGGKGGQGGWGSQCTGTCDNGGDGGKGGKAGDGGAGGKGGNGANANDIFISLPDNQVGQIIKDPAPSNPGAAGVGGPPGQQGRGGDPGGASMYCNGGSTGPLGDTGATGSQGSAGNSGGKPARIYINGFP
jgi:hypothetical protein